MQSAVKALVEGAFGGASPAFAAQLVSPYAVIWSEQDGPYPGHPYAVISEEAPPVSRGGMPAYSFVDGGGLVPDLERSEYDAEWTFRVELLTRSPRKAGAGTAEPIALLGAFEGWARSRANLEALDGAGLALISVGQPVHVPKIAGFGNERRAYLNLTFAVRVRVDVPQPFVLDRGSLIVSGTVDLAGNATGQVGGP